MPRYGMYFVATASQYVEVEADSLDEAIDKGYDSLDSGNYAFVPSEIGDWELDDGVEEL